MKKALLNLYFWPVFFLVTSIGLILAPFIFLFCVLVLKKKPATCIRHGIRIYGWVIVCVVPFMAPVKVKGSANRMRQPSIIVANHTSAIDPYLFGAIPIENCFVTSWPFKIPVYKHFMKFAGYINTARGWDAIRAQCTKMLDQGVFITIWPEGHRSKNGKMGRFRRGAFQLSVETGYPIQPVCIIGSGKIMPPGKRLLSPGRVMLIILDPIFPDPHETDIQIAINSLRKKTVAAIKEVFESGTFSAMHYTHLPFNSCNRFELSHFSKQSSL